MKLPSFKFLMILALLSLVKLSPASAQRTAVGQLIMNPAADGAIFTFKADIGSPKRNYIEVTRNPQTNELNFMMSKSVRFTAEESDIISLTWNADGSFKAGKGWNRFRDYDYKMKERHQRVLHEDNYVNHSTMNPDPDLIRNAYASVKRVILAVADGTPIPAAQLADFFLSSYLVARRNVDYIGYNIQFIDELRIQLENEAQPFRCIKPMTF